MELQGKTVLITGATGGIGRAIAATLSRAGATLALHCRSKLADAEALAASLPGKGHRAYAAELSDPHACEVLIETVAREQKRLDVLVNNAGVFEVKPLPDLSYADWQANWQKTLAANLIAPANLSFLAARVMQAQGGGKIVNISSRGAFRGEPNAVAYGASKAGLNQLSQSLAQALAPYNIFVGVIAPGFVATDMATASLEGKHGDAIRKQSPLNRVALPEEVAEAVLRLAADGMMYATGCILDLNGASYLRS